MIGGYRWFVWLCQMRLRVRTVADGAVGLEEGAQGLARRGGGYHCGVCVDASV